MKNIIKLGITLMLLLAAAPLEPMHQNQRATNGRWANGNHSIWKN